MTVLIPKLSGFCPGVKNAEKNILKTKDELESQDLCVLGMMINNRSHVEFLNTKGIKTMDKPEDIPDKAVIAVRTHGIDRTLEKELSETHHLIDLTCINVKKVQKKIAEASAGGSSVIITGKKTHPEVLGLQSYAENFTVIETSEDLEAFIKNPEFSRSRSVDIHPESFFITSQTTGSRVLFDSTCSAVKEHWPETNVTVFDSICPVTRKKEEEALELQKQADISFVIGDKLSSNASKLFHLLYEADEHTYFIQNLEDLKSRNINLTDINKALIVSSASTPDFIEYEIKEYLEGIPDFL